MNLPNLFIINILRDICQMPIWWLTAFHKRDPQTWVFGSWVGHSYSDNSRNVYEYVLEHCKDIKAVWLTNEMKVYERLTTEGKPVAMIYSSEGIRCCRNAGYAFMSNGIYDVNPFNVNGIRQIWLWHGMPLKKVGYDHPMHFSVFKDSIRGLFPFRNHAKSDTPYMFVSISDMWNPNLKSAFHISEDRILVSGLPRNDSFFDGNHESIISEMNRLFNNPVKILYMPTFRDYTQKYGKVSFNPFGGFGFCADKFKKLLDDENLVFMFKGHYVDLNVGKLKDNYGERFMVLDESMYDNMYSLIKDIDILITDYSSIYFDFLLLKKPVILAPFDYSEYISESREFYFDYNSTIEGIRAYNWDELAAIIKEHRYYFPSHALEKMHHYTDGNSSKRVVDAVLKDIATFNS